MQFDEQLQQFLTASGVKWDILPANIHRRLCGQWDGIYANSLNPGLEMRHKHGVRAQLEYGQHTAREFLIVPFLGSKGGLHGLGNSGARTAAYACEGSGDLPDLSSFANMDFFIVPPNMCWTMIHTHEDYALGGPYFMERDWLVPPTRKPARVRRTGFRL